jgi:hypothetical protein
VVILPSLPNMVQIVMVDFLAVAKYRGSGWRGWKEEVVGSGGVSQLNC